MKIVEVLGKELHSEIERLLGPDTPAEIRAGIEAVFRRSPPARLSPNEMQLMYNPDYEDDILRRRKLKADAEKAESEALLARAKAADQRLGTSRAS